MRRLTFLLVVACIGVGQSAVLSHGRERFSEVKQRLVEFDQERQLFSDINEQFLEKDQRFIFKADMNKVHFLLWTRRNPGSSYELILNDFTNLENSHFNSSRLTHILVHGWESNGHHKWPMDAKTELLKHHDCNIISIDWSKIADHVYYYGVVKNLHDVGNHSAQFLDFLHKETGLNLSTVYMTGHSLGAHLSGIIGSLVQNGPIGRITGLDPAAPTFDSVSDDKKLDKSDAMFVDVIHTNAGSLLHFCAGLDESLGHVDFYPNGGHHQPGCTFAGAWTDLLRGGCSHGRAWKYWIESINGPVPFTSRPCSTWEAFKKGNCTGCGQGCLNMGFHASDAATLRGVYYLRTASEKPYALGNK